jgi:hypothetical protein
MRRPFLSRRAVLQSSAATAAAALLPRRVLAAPGTERSALVAIFLQGGFNSFFNAAEPFLKIPPGGPGFGVTANNVTPVGDHMVDAETFGTLSPWALSHMANIGVRHNIVNHVEAVRADWTYEGRSAAVHLAAALGPSPSVPCALVGTGSPPGAPGTEAGVAFQSVTDMGSVLRLIGAQTRPQDPSRQLMGRVLQATQRAAGTFFDDNASTVGELENAFSTTASVLAQPSQQVDFDELALAYGLTGASGPSTAIESFASKVAAAELLIRTGTHVAAIVDNGSESGGTWDTHFVLDGSADRQLMKGHVLKPLKTLLTRMETWTDLNAVVVIFGDFARTLPLSDHAASLVPAVFGRYVKQGSTGRMSVSFDTQGTPRSDLPADTPGIPELWAYLAAVLKVPGRPFGTNPHQLIVHT